MPYVKKRGLEFLEKIFKIITCQVNGNYCAGNKTNEFPTD